MYKNAQVPQENAEDNNRTWSNGFVSFEVGKRGGKMNPYYIKINIFQVGIRKED